LRTRQMASAAISARRPYRPRGFSPRARKRASRRRLGTTLWAVARPEPLRARWAETSRGSGRRNYSVGAQTQRPELMNSPPAQSDGTWPVGGRSRVRCPPRRCSSAWCVAPPWSREGTRRRGNQQRSARGAACLTRHRERGQPSSCRRRCKQPVCNDRIGSMHAIRTSKLLDPACPRSLAAIAATEGKPTKNSPSKCCTANHRYSYPSSNHHKRLRAFSNSQARGVKKMNKIWHSRF
jgi:hypothetical protein